MKKKVLIVDDEPLIRRSLAKAFALEGWEVLSAEDGATGFELWTQQKPDLILLDVLMPGWTGPQVLEKASAELKSQTKIVMMSAYTGDWNQTKVLDLGADLFIPKPFNDILGLTRSLVETLGFKKPSSPKEG